MKFTRPNAVCSWHFPTIQPTSAATSSANGSQGLSLGVVVGGDGGGSEEAVGYVFELLDGQHRFRFETLIVLRYQ
jgi:hypothetical protein